MIDDGDSLHTTQSARKAEAGLFAELAFPATFGFLGEGIKTFGDVRRRRFRLLRVAENLRTENAKDSRLFNDLPVVTTVESIEKVANDARLIDHLAQVFAGALFARGKAQHSLFNASGDQIIFKRALVFQVLLRFSARDFIERRLCNEDVAALDQFLHLPEEKCQ